MATSCRPEKFRGFTGRADGEREADWLRWFPQFKHRVFCDRELDASKKIDLLASFLLGDALEFFDDCCEYPDDPSESDWRRVIKQLEARFGRAKTPSQAAKEYGEVLRRQPTTVQAAVSSFYELTVLASKKAESPQEKEASAAMALRQFLDMLPSDLRLDARKEFLPKLKDGTRISSHEVVDFVTEQDRLYGHFTSPAAHGTTKSGPQQPVLGIAADNNIAKPSGETRGNFGAAYDGSCRTVNGVCCGA